MSSRAYVRGETGELGDYSSSVKLFLSSGAIPYLLPTADALIILLASLAGGIGYQLSVGHRMPDILPLCAVGLLAGFIYVVRMNGRGYYHFAESAKLRVEAGELLICWMTTGLFLAFLAFLLKIGADYSRGAFVAFYFLAPAGLLGMRKITKVALTAAVSRGAIGYRNTVLIGDFNEIANLERQALHFLGTADQVNRFELSRDDDPSIRSSTDIRILDSAANFVRNNNCREILLALPWSDADRIEFVRDRIKTLPVAARLLPDMRVRSLTSLSSSTRQHAITIEVQRAPLSGAQRLLKRLTDIVVSAMALVFLLPIMALTAIAIRVDSPGPVIFRQNRKGFNGRQFVIFKFRTMTVQENGPTVEQAKQNDPRVTAIGRLLRSASIDELPQLLNVLNGDMSLIGPRPHALAHDDYFENILSDYAFRHHVKPGITGWAQCNGARGATPSIEQISERVRLDLWYINNWSFWLDIRILIRTFFVVLARRNAY